MPGRRRAVSFWAFDLLWVDDELLLDRPYLERRQRLEELPLAGPCGVLPRFFPGLDAADLLAACRAHDVEGIVLKRLRPIYRPGERSRSVRRGQIAACPCDVESSGPGPELARLA
jgi:bifunctional non-homologous end joining protein LigD